MDAFEDWNSRFPRGAETQHRTLALTEDSVFLFEQTTAPRPQPIYFGTWNWYDNAYQLQAHLLQVVMPDMASAWMSEGSLGLQVMRQPLIKTIDDASEEWEEDVEFFRELAIDIEQASGPTSYELACELQEITDRFSRKYGRTPTWDLSLTVLPSTPAAGTYLFDRNPELVMDSNGTPISRAEWLHFCAQAPTDTGAAQTVLTVFDAADEF
jgi:hypothetical protein